MDQRQSRIYAQNHTNQRRARQSRLCDQSQSQKRRPAQNRDVWRIAILIMETAIVVENITKTYGRKKEILAVADVSFTVSKGELFGLIGPDGAGKTSIFRMLTTLLLPDSGNAKVDGFDIVKDYAKI